MLFMGQEFLEDKQWADDLELHANLLLHWAGVDAGDKQMLDHIRFTRELLGLRWRQPALRGEGFRPVHVHDQNRVLAFHRWVPGEGHDVMVVVHLSTFNRFDYRIGFPGGGEWREVFNSDVYENWVNPNIAGNGGRVFADPRRCTASASPPARAAGQQRPRVRALSGGHARALGAHDRQKEERMIKVVVLLRRSPSSTRERFHRWWLDEHVPYAKVLPGLRKYRVCLVTGSTTHEGREPWDGIAELWFDSRAALDAAWSSEVGPDGARSTRGKATATAWCSSPRSTS